MSFDLDNFCKYENPEFHAKSSRGFSADALSGLETAEELLISLSVLQRMGVKCDDRLGSARNTLALAYLRADLAEGVKSADALVKKYERDLNAALDTAMGQQRSR